MDKDKKIRELELEVSRLKGVIEGMRSAPYQVIPRPYPVINPAPYPYPQPFWYQTYCTSNTVGQSTPAIGTNHVN